MSQLLKEIQQLASSAGLDCVRLQRKLFDAPVDAGAVHEGLTGVQTKLAQILRRTELLEQSTEGGEPGMREVVEKLSSPEVIEQLEQRILDGMVQVKQHHRTELVAEIGPKRALLVDLIGPRGPIGKFFSPEYYPGGTGMGAPNHMGLVLHEYDLDIVSEENLAGWPTGFYTGKDGSTQILIHLDNHEYPFPFAVVFNVEALKDVTLAKVIYKGADDHYTAVQLLDLDLEKLEQLLHEVKSWYDARMTERYGERYVKINQG